MTDKSTPPERLTLARWSRRKLESAAEAAAPSSASAAPSTPATATPSAPASVTPGAPVSAPELPSIDSLNFDSDFTAFLRPEVDEKLKRAALKQLFRDPRFNVMDGLDTYIDDYTRADPIEPGVLKEMLQRFSAVASTSTGPADDAPAQQQAAADAVAPSNAQSASLPATGAEPATAAEDRPEESSA